MTTLRLSLALLLASAAVSQERLLQPADLPARAAAAARLERIVDAEHSLATTVALAWALPGTAEAGVLVGLTAVASVLIWGSFNWQHRRINRARNLALSTTMALALIAAAAYLLAS